MFMDISGVFPKIPKILFGKSFSNRIFDTQKTITDTNRVVILNSVTGALYGVSSKNSLKTVVL